MIENCRDPVEPFLFLLIEHAGWLETNRHSKIGSIAAFRAMGEKGGEAEMHKAALEELATSFEADVEPLLIDVDGRTMRLTGSLEAQFASWRKLLHDLFETETGLPADPNTGAPAAVEGQPEK